MKTVKHTFDAFCKARKISREWLASPDGHLKIDGRCKWLPEDELVVGGNLDINHCKIDRLPPRVVVGGDLHIQFCDFEEFPSYLEVKGTAVMIGTKFVSLHEGCHFHGTVLFLHSMLRQIHDYFHVAGDFSLLYCPIQELPKGLVVDGCLSLIGSGIRSIPSDCQCRTLNVSHSKVEKLPENWSSEYLSVENSSIRVLPNGLSTPHGLNISYTDIQDIEGVSLGVKLLASHSKLAQLPDHLILDILDISDSEVTHIPAGIVCRKIYCDTSKVQIDCYRFAQSGTDFHPNGKYVVCDNILSEVIEHKGNIWRCRSIENGEEHFIISDGKEHYAHGVTIESARLDLAFKCSDRDTSRYSKLQLDDTLTFEESIVCYRTITGACRYGTEQFIRSLPEVKDTYTIREIIQGTKGQYGHRRFRAFFQAV